MCGLHELTLPRVSAKLFLCVFKKRKILVQEICIHYELISVIIIKKFSKGNSHDFIHEPDM